MCVFSVLQRSKAVHEFTVVTYNILCESMRLQVDYSHTDESYLGPDYRGYRIIQEVKHLNPDVVCFQEFDEGHHHDSLAKNLHS